MKSESKNWQGVFPALTSFWVQVVRRHSYEWLFFLIGIALVVCSHGQLVPIASELIRDAGIAFMISVLLTVLLDGQMRRKHNTELLQKIDTNLEEVSLSVTKQHEAVASAIQQNQREILTQIQSSAQHIQNRLVQDALTFKFGPEVMDEICRTITEAPFLRSNYDIEFEFERLPIDWELDPDEFILLRMTVECDASNVSFEPADYRSYLPSLGLSASSKENKYIFSGVFVDNVELNALKDEKTGKLATAEEIWVASGSTIHVVYRLDIPRRVSDHEVFFTYLPSKDLKVATKGFRDVGIDSVKLQATHRKGVIPIERGLPPKKPEAVSWTFPTPLIPFQGFELAWTSCRDAQEQT